MIKRLDPTGIEPEISRPSADRIIAGDPVHTTWLIEESADGKVFAGIWASTPGAWRVQYDEWEFCCLLDGVSVLTAADGTEQRFKAGDQFVIQPGFTGIWTVVEPTRKTFVIRLP